MALTLNNFTGFETQGDEEANATAGSITFNATGGRNNGAYITLNSSIAEYELLWVVTGATDGGNDYIVGAGVRFDDVTPTDVGVFLEIHDDADSVIISLQLQANGDVLVQDANQATIRTLTPTLVDATFHFFEIYFQHSATGTIEVFIDEFSEGSDSNEDLTDGNGFGGAGSHLKLRRSADIVSRYDDIYILSGATDADDRLGPVEVFGYQSDSSDGTNLENSRTWAEAGDTPGVEESDATAVQVAGGTSTTAIVDLVDGANSRGLPGGPSTGAPNDVSDTIKGAKWIYNLHRSNGSGTSMRYIYGNTGETATSSVDIEASLTDTAYTIFEQISEAASVVPTASEDFRYGISAGTDDTGSRELFAADIWAMLLHVPAADTNQAMAPPKALLSLEPYTPDLVQGHNNEVPAIV